MKNRIKLLALLLVVSLTSCATIAQSGDELTSYQKTKPEIGHRQINFDALLFGIAFPPSLIVDIATDRIFRQYPRGYYPFDVRPNNVKRKWRVENGIYVRNY